MITLTVDDTPGVTHALQVIMNRIDPAGTHLTALSGVDGLNIALRQPVDVIFLDIEMPDMNGIELARKLKEQRPQSNLVFITGYVEYAKDVLDLYFSAYLLKPITEAKVREALNHLRYPVRAGTEKRLKIQCFGYFEAWCDGVPIQFQRKRTKQLLAFLIDRKGAMCDISQMVCALWPESENDASYINQVRVFLSDLQTTLTTLGLGKALLRKYGKAGINKELLDCDYYDYLRGDSEAVKLFHGEYMSQYSFGEMTLATLRGTAE